ncbi:hypothetical protein RDI58_024499 [Solanum bulbocastanum]|uniref:Alliinase C-terminal domain-containing protein n=1 Tax=Solanum bulbocastanum TaxID=147425 RepID=A0AAN8T3F1_SOLBU
MCGTNGCLTKGSSIPRATLENDTKDTFTTINLDHGDPTVYESYWSKMGNKCDIAFNGDNSLSYFANGKSLCWFLDQLMQAAHFALSPTDQLEPISVVSATLFYSAYPEVTDFVRLGLHKWYTAITSPANHDVMLFTISKCTGHTAFAWLICKGGEEEDCQKLLKEHKIHTRSGNRFGSDSRNVRISMLSRDEDFNIFLKRLMAIQGPTNGN